MPDTLSMTTGVSLGLLAGIVSGVCYLFANGFSKTSNEGHRKRLTSSSDEGRGVCAGCGGDKRGGVIPCICEHQNPVKFETGAWFLRQVQRTISMMPWSFSTDKLEQIDEEYEGHDSLEHRELRNVREFLETLSARLAGGPLETTRLSPLYNHSAYLPPRTPTPSAAAAPSSAHSAHSQLKRLVARVVEEAAALPALARYAAEPSTPTIDTSTYEDLLATAILNKVIERYQHENGSGGRSSGIHSASASPTPSERSSPRSLNSRQVRDISPPLREELERDDVSDWEEGEATVSDDIELPRRVPFPEFGGDIVHHADNDEREFDEVSSSDLQAVDSSWEENWLFQKKKIKSLHSVPVPMLVPNSNTDYRALIGDRDADDTTDLSDNASESEEEETEYKSDIKRVLDSKHVIGGMPKLDDMLDFEPDSLTILDEPGEDKDNVVDAVNNDLVQTKVPEILQNGNRLVYCVDSGPLPKAEFAFKEEVHRTLLNGNVEDYAAVLDAKVNGDLDKDVVDGSKMNKGSTNTTLSRHEREGEYEETITMPVQRYADSLRRKHFEDEAQVIPTRDTDKEDDLKPGTVAYRERKKWENCVDMPNNPYSPENIQKRLLAKSTSSLFDMLTSKKDDDDMSVKSEVIKRNGHIDEVPVKEAKNINLSMDNVNGTGSKSPSPKILKDVLADDISQYKRYGRDYYIRDAKKSSGSRKSLSETSSMSSMNKSMSLDNLSTEAAPVSASSSLSDLEACALHHNIVRAVLSPRHTSPNFAINPIFENSEKSDADEITDNKIKSNVRQQTRTECDGGDGYVENEDIIRLKIPQKPEITEDLFESYTHVRRNNTLRSEDLCPRSKRRPALNYTFGGSLRLSKGFRSDLCNYNSNPRKKLVGILIKQFNSIATNQQYTKFANNEIPKPITITGTNKTEIYIEYDDTHAHLFNAKPVYVDDDTDKKFEEIFETVNKVTNENDDLKSPTSDTSFISSSSMEDSIKIYNVPSGEIIKGDKALSKMTDSNDNIDMPDKNTSDDDKLSQDEDMSEESLVIVNLDSLKEETDKKFELVDEIEEILPQLPKVKELAKKFVTMETSEPVQPTQPPRRKKSKDNILSSENKSKHFYMHSLTARSISKQFREELKLSMATPLTIPGGTKEIPEGEEIIKESSRPGSPVPEPGTIKTKLAFFESLKSKFSK